MSAIAAAVGIFVSITACMLDENGKTTKCNDWQPEAFGLGDIACAYGGAQQFAVKWLHDNHPQYTALMYSKCNRQRQIPT